MDKLNSIQYIVNHNPVCEDCARGNLDQVRKAAGLYQALKDILADISDITADLLVVKANRCTTNRYTKFL